MLIDMLKGKIHRATVVQAELDYVGSITVDEALLDLSLWIWTFWMQQVFWNMKRCRLLTLTMAVVLRPIQLPEKEVAE